MELASRDGWDRAPGSGPGRWGEDRGLQRACVSYTVHQVTSQFSEKKKMDLTTHRPSKEKTYTARTPADSVPPTVETAPKWRQEPGCEPQGGAGPALWVAPSLTDWERTGCTGDTCVLLPQGRWTCRASSLSSTSHCVGAISLLTAVEDAPGSAWVNQKDAMLQKRCPGVSLSLWPEALGEAVGCVRRGFLTLGLS